MTPQTSTLDPDASVSTSRIVADAPAEGPGRSAPPSMARLSVLLGVLSALGPLSIDTYLPSLPSIAREFGAAPGHTEFTLSAYFVGLAGAQLFWGHIADRYGRRRPLLVGLALYTLGAVACATAPSLATLIAARALQGVGGASTLAIVRAIVRDHWSGRDAARVLSLVTLVMGAAPILAPSLGAALARSGWRSVFVLLALAGGAMVSLVAWRVPRGSRPLGGTSLQRSLREALADPLFRTFTLASSLAQAGLFAYIAGSSALFIGLMRLSPTAYAVCFGANASGLIALSQVNRVLLRRWDPCAIAARASAALSFAAALFALVAHSAARAHAAPSFVLVTVAVFLFVCLLGLVTSNAVSVALERQGSRAGVASALMGTLQFASSALASALVGALADGTARPMSTVMLAGAAGAAVTVSLGRRTLGASSAGSSTVHAPSPTGEL